jgi:hypothetical protein
MRFIGSSTRLGGPIFVSSIRKKQTKMKKFQKSLLALFVFASSAVFAQDRPMHEVYGAMVFNFTKYVQWPDHADAGEFVIGIVGNADLFTTLNTWYGGKPRGNKTYVIKKFNSAADITNCHVVFIDKSKSGEFEAVNNKVKGKGTLVITDKAGLGERGSGINFKNVDNKLKFELNQRALEASNLKVAGALSSMAILI